MRDARVSLGSMTSPEVAPIRPILLVPLGSTEQHGPHLPLDTDTHIAIAVAERTAAGGDDVLVAPAVAYGASGEHAAFPGTLSIGTEALVVVLLELARSADHFAHLVWVCGHGGNVDALGRASEMLAAEGRRTTTFVCGVEGGDAHAGRTETSMMMALAPGLVRLHLAEAGDTRPWADMKAEVLAGGIGAVSPSGVLGDPTGATAAEGERFLAEIVARLLGVVARCRDA